MKKFFLLAVMLLVGAFAAGAQTTKVSDKTVVEGKNYTTSKATKSSKDIATEYTWANTKDNVSYPIFLHKYTKGDKAGQWTAYVMKVSKKTGKEYKYYLPDGEAITADILRRNPNLVK